MAVAKREKDRYANLAIVSIPVGAAGLLFAKLETGISFNDKVAYLINRVEYTLRGALHSMMAGIAADISVGLCYSNTLPDANPSNALIIDAFNYRKDAHTLGAPASGWSGQMVPSPFVRDFSMMPGGGLLTPPNPLYLFKYSNFLAIEPEVVARIYYTVVELTTEDYWELVEARRVLTT